jgi:hypothetical protein
MPDALKRAKDRFTAGDYKKAASLLWEVTSDDEASARAVLDLAAALRQETSGSLQSQCDSLVSRAKIALESRDAESAAERVAALKAEFAKDPALLARRAAEAGLRWLKIEAEEDDLTDSLEAAIRAWVSGAQNGQAKPCLIDAVEAEGWSFEQAQDLFVPTKLSSSVFAGIDEPINGHLRRIYPFRRSPKAGAGTRAH